MAARYSSTPILSVRLSPGHKPQGGSRSQASACPSGTWPLGSAAWERDTLTLSSTPPGDAGLVRSAALAADVVIVTLPTGLIDIDRLSPTLELLAEVEASNPIRIRILLTRVRTGTRSAQAARALLAELGQPVLEHEIPLREAYTSGFGLAPTDLLHYQPVVDELLARAAAA